MANDIVYKLAIDAANFSRGMESSRAQAQQFSRDMQNMTREARHNETVISAAGKEHQRTAMMVQQLSYGLEDAASQWGTSGLAGAIRGASNNLSAAGALMGPQVALMSSLGSTALMLGVQYLTAGKDVQSFEKDMRSVREEYYRVGAAAQRAREQVAHGFSIEDVQRVAQAREAIDGQQNATREMEKVRVDMETRTEWMSREMQKMMVDELAQLREAEPRMQFKMEGINPWFDPTAHARAKKNLDDVRDRMKEIDRLTRLNPGKLVEQFQYKPLLPKDAKADRERMKEIEKEKNKVKELTNEYRNQNELRDSFARKLPELKKAEADAKRREQETKDHQRQAQEQEWFAREMGQALEQQSRAEVSARRDAQREADKKQRDAQRVADRLLSPQQAFDKQMKDLRTTRDANPGLINDEMMRRAETEARAKMARDQEAWKKMRPFQPPAPPSVMSPIPQREKPKPIPRDVLGSIWERTSAYAGDMARAAISMPSPVPGLTPAGSSNQVIEALMKAITALTTTEKDRLSFDKQSKMGSEKKEADVVVNF